MSRGRDLDVRNPGDAPDARNVPAVRDAAVRDGRGAPDIPDIRDAHDLRIENRAVDRPRGSQNPAARDRSGGAADAPSESRDAGRGVTCERSDKRPREPRHDSRADSRDEAHQSLRDRPARRIEVPTRGLTLPRTSTRERVEARGQVYHLRDSEVRTLATVGTFRVVPVRDLEPGRNGRDMWNGDFHELARQGLIDRKTVVINHEPTPTVALTREGKTLLEAYQETRPDDRHQRYHAGFVKPREVAHDAQLYRLYQAAAARIEADGGRVSRVVLDYELKRDYQSFLNRKDRPDDWSREEDMRTFAAERALPIVDNHLELPDLRVEYETLDGRFQVRDLELVTQHYSRSQLSGKAQAGFALYRAIGRGRNGGRRGGTPFDPHHLELIA